MDKLDVRILRELIQGHATFPSDPDFRKSYRALARAVGVDEHTVRNRIKGFHESGFIEDWRCYANPHLTGACALAAWFDVPAGVRQGDLVEQLTLVPGVYLVNRFIGTLIAALFLVPDERFAQRRLELLRMMSKTEILAAGRVPFPPCRITLSKEDRRILRSISLQPWNPYKTIAKEVDLSSRTVKRRLVRLSREGAIFALPALNPKALRASMWAVVLVTYPPGLKDEINRKIADRLDPYLWLEFPMLPMEPNGAVPCAFNVMLPNVTMAPEIRRWVEQLDGVMSARVELFEEVLTMYEPLETLTEHRTE